MSIHCSERNENQKLQIEVVVYTLSILKVTTKKILSIAAKEDFINSFRWLRSQNDPVSASSWCQMFPSCQVHTSIAGVCQGQCLIGVWHNKLVYEWPTVMWFLCMHTLCLNNSKFWLHLEYEIECLHSVL